MLFITKSQVSSSFSNQFSLLGGNKCHHCWPGGLLPAPPPLPLCDWQLSISVNHQSSPLSPTPPRLCSVSSKLVLGAALSDGKTNDFSLASLHSHTETRQRADGAASRPNTHDISTRTPLEFTDEESPQNSGIYLHTHWWMDHFIEWIFILFYFFLPTPNIDCPYLS